DVRPHGNVLPGLEIERIENDTGGKVHRAGSRNADGGDLRHGKLRGLDRGANRFAHALQTELLAALRFRGEADGAQWQPGAIDDAALHRRAADVQSDKQRQGTHASDLTAGARICQRKSLPCAGVRATCYSLARIFFSSRSNSDASRPARVR